MLVLYCFIICSQGAFLHRLVMLDEVTIIQTKLNRQKLEHENAGQTDIIYSYHNAIGTHGKRIVVCDSF